MVVLSSPAITLQEFAQGSKTGINVLNLRCVREIGAVLVLT